MRMTVHIVSYLSKGCISIKPKATFKTEHILFKMKNTVCFSTMVKMSECLREENIDAYMNLTDDIIRVILLSPDPRLEKARQLVRDLWRRKLYKFVDESPPIAGIKFAHVRRSSFLFTIDGLWG